MERPQAPSASKTGATVAISKTISGITKATTVCAAACRNRAGAPTIPALDITRMGSGATSRNAGLTNGRERSVRRRKASQMRQSTSNLHR